MKKIIFLLSLVIIIVSSCKIFKGGKTLTHISFLVDFNKPINYGYKLQIKTTANYSNGKTKDITSKSDLTINIVGAKYQKGIIYCNSNPTSFQKDTINISASYRKDDKDYSTSLVIPFNYKGSLNFNFNGKSGKSGAKGVKGGTTILFRNGKDGGIGDDGEDGGFGHDLTMFVWKENNLYYIKINDMTDNKTYYYKANDLTQAYNIYVVGGSGGQGGQGGYGGDGRDGKKTEKKIKLPGNGGDGGLGGQGGNGGKGGNVYVFIHPNATNFQQKIYTNNNGGNPGAGGQGGKAGSGGTPLEGQSPTKNGNVGTNGSSGLQGAQGDVINIEVQQFDIEDVKNN